MDFLQGDATGRNQLFGGKKEARENGPAGRIVRPHGLVCRHDVFILTFTDGADHCGGGLDAETFSALQPLVILAVLLGREVSVLERVSRLATIEDRLSEKGTPSGGCINRLTCDGCAHVLEHRRADGCMEFVHQGVGSLDVRLHDHRLRQRQINVLLNHQPDEGGDLGPNQSPACEKLRHVRRLHSGVVRNEVVPMADVGQGMDVAWTAAQLSEITEDHGLCSFGSVWTGPGGTVVGHGKGGSVETARLLT